MSAAVDPTHGPGAGGADDGDRPDLAHVRRMWADDRASAGLGMELLAARHRPRPRAA